MERKGASALARLRIRRGRPISMMAEAMPIISRCFEIGRRRGPRFTQDQIWSTMWCSRISFNPIMFQRKRLKDHLNQDKGNRKRDY